jgi:hypothetical protein
MTTRIQLRRDTGANWTSEDPILASGEIGIETDASPIKFKIGDGVTAWSSLAYFVGSFDIHALTEKTTIADEDEFPLADSAASFAAKQIAWRNVTRRIFQDALGEIVELEDDFSTGADGWTLGTGWAHDAGNEWVEHTPGSVDALSYPGTLIDGSKYYIIINVGGTTGTVTVGVDENSAVIPAGAGTVQVYARCIGAGSTLVFVTPSTDFDGYISSVTVVRVPLVQDMPEEGVLYGRQDYEWTPLGTVFQPLDADLTAIAALTPTNDDVLQRKAGAWVNRTIAQLITDLTSGLSALFAPLAKGVTNGDSHDHVGGDGAQIDHGGLAGLGDDDHTQYVKKSTLEGHYYLPFGVNDTINPLTANGNPYAATVDRTLTMIKFTVALYVVTTNDGSNYWTISLKRLSDNAQVAAFNTSALSPNVYNQLSTITFDISSVGTAGIALIVGAAKTGSPGNLYIWGPALEIST